ncbi:hypothetical protein FTUN_7087 [Frigoriglobus tundricola]|uniref:Uncharacterized protein n=1 Tax=Frigoriglobus tundricola TaxID=2774151 RepID=A0A6M5YZU9_9BACT|nr:hypothetical protein FTUN_7087 [Frigoriglobus tundricola]
MVNPLTRRFAEPDRLQPIHLSLYPERPRRTIAVIGSRGS